MYMHWESKAAMLHHVNSVEEIHTLSKWMLHLVSKKIWQKKALTFCSFVTFSNWNIINAGGPTTNALPMTMTGHPPAPIPPVTVFSGNACTMLAVGSCPAMSGNFKTARIPYTVGNLLPAVHDFLVACFRCEIILFFLLLDDSSSQIYRTWWS